MKAWKWCVTGALALALAGCGGGNGDMPGAVSSKSILGAAADTTSWQTYGRTYDEQRFSPADQINTGNVGQLGLAWYADLDTARGQEATPLVIDGKIYISTAWSKVKAYDGITGKLLWEYDPKVPGETAVKACCDVVNRGLAAWGDSLFIGTLDGRLISLDRNTGKVNWSTETTDKTKDYTITGAPRVIKGMVIIGNGGAEFGVRGYVTAYGAKDGKQLWRFYIVPGKPGEDKEDYLKAAAKTWTGDYWKLGGGGTAWDAMAYDPDLDLLYIGTGNGSPWNPKYRSPGAGGDNLYLSSIVAIKPETGAYVWHFQETPNEAWDFTATQHIMLADLTIDGKPRKVLMHAPKNGFFYVIDRTNGKFISGKNFVPVTWATGLTPEGKPIENPASRYYLTGKPWIGMPGAGGAHSWHPMAYNPKHGLVYIPAQIAAFPYFPDDSWKPSKQGFNVGVNMGAGAMPAIPAVREGAKAATKGALIAWDPVAQKERWRVDYPGPWNGGLLSTAGDLVFEGNAMGGFAAYDAGDGKKLWNFDAQTGVIAAPVTYTINGEQYVAVLAGWGGVWSLAPGILSKVSGPERNISRLLVFKLGGKAQLPAPPPDKALPLDPPPSKATPETVAAGANLYGRYCGVCHGDAAIAGGITPDLRHSGALESADTWQQIVHGGALKDNGMVGWASVMSPAEIEAIRLYVIKRANEDKAIGPN